mmetsp:Transcript_23881/g.42736  ORF Transcript_23881/g.42736 Transcript_23881/m.42736 type:complete len:254 (+) Transcript_23881:149-910(+)
MPHGRNTWTLIMRMILLQHSRPLKIPKQELPITIPTTNKPSIGTNGNIARVSRDIVTLHFFLSLQTVPIPRLVDNDAIIEALTKHELFAGVHGNDRHGMHGGVRNVLDWYSNVPFPNQNLFIITRGYHLHAIVLDECDGVNGRQMMIILLRNFSRGGIISNNFIVGTPHDKDVIIVGVEFDNVRNAAVRIRSQNFTRFNIPQSQKSIERCRDEFCSVIIELHIPYRRTVPDIRSHTLFLFDRPYLARPIQPCT